MDRDLTWRAIHPWIIRNGHAWVGVTQAPVMARTLSHAVDSDRYGQLSIRDSVLAWEIVSQVASALRAGALGITGVSSMYMSGWSMTGTFCRVFLGDGFHARTRTADDGPAIDGYVIGISSGSFMAGGYQPVSDGSGFLPATPRRPRQTA